uniref:Uncharacterized protein n=1 Tax=Romanomermis culicivorax TaxID=13658 RepID=A0A915KVJ0_ROMCU
MLEQPSNWQLAQGINLMSNCQSAPCCTIKNRISRETGENKKFPCRFSLARSCDNWDVNLALLLLLGIGVEKPENCTKLKLDGESTIIRTSTYQRKLPCNTQIMKI